MAHRRRMTDAEIIAALEVTVEEYKAIKDMAAIIDALNQGETWSEYVVNNPAREAARKERRVAMGWDKSVTPTETTHQAGNETLPWKYRNDGMYGG